MKTANQGLKSRPVIARGEGPGHASQKISPALKGRHHLTPRRFTHANCSALSGREKMLLGHASSDPGLHPGLSHCALSGLPTLEPKTCAKRRVTRKEFPLDSLTTATVTGLWIHEEDLRVRPFATGGFFQFWERLREILVTNSTENDFPEQQTLVELRP